MNSAIVRGNCTRFGNTRGWRLGSGSGLKRESSLPQPKLWVTDKGRDWHTRKTDPRKILDKHSLTKEAVIPQSHARRYSSGLWIGETASFVVDESTGATAAQITVAANNLRAIMQNLLNNPNVSIDMIYNTLAYRAREQNLRAFAWGGDPAEEPHLKPLPRSDFQPLVLPNGVHFPETRIQFLALTTYIEGLRAPPRWEPPCPYESSAKICLLRGRLGNEAAESIFGRWHTATTT
ncbi:uncharacterized protein FOMMEDRAFT_161946 [Fomitiporia mediterranea MF3/22]|uniref:uncharacterized protein n=1 Tax=Fomitiporia mediterranea (strain MF3/22) TaxID=694068 RepID=UPI000440736B|nr:uncharacterized protein FOMMEDRAFT_161946 [Fomitiporia mediterranea MF3/22]EJC98195.1 hypothetical protein FOMMEDRAFT_161946 [Fomitiporia mediterranea MF3/22]